MTISANFYKFCCSFIVMHHHASRWHGARLLENAALSLSCGERPRPATPRERPKTTGSCPCQAFRAGLARSRDAEGAWGDLVSGPGDRGVGLATAARRGWLARGVPGSTSVPGLTSPVKVARQPGDAGNAISAPRKQSSAYESPRVRAR
jgi:hypothetical protein